jgi:16S rRNA (cytosine1402-N4)-methyltransferase
MTHTDYHIPVLLEESVSWLLTDPDGIYVDGTIGGGGHSEAILEKLSPEGRVYGIDQDDEALEQTRQRLGDDHRLELIKGNFGFMKTLLPPDTIGKVNGILLDLGVSSHQIDEPERGFSFQAKGPLDMRMGDLRAQTAEQVINSYEFEDLRNIFFEFGEERQSNRIARAIIDNRPVTTTEQLSRIILTVAKGPHAVKSVARIFQAIRIEVNRELEMLGMALEKGLDILKEDGRYVVISYHSLEDRKVKQFFKTGNLEGTLHKDFYGNDITPLQMLTPKIITASESEIRENPRARSARLRVAAKKERQD